MPPKALRKIALIIPFTLLLLVGCNKDLGFIVEYDNAEGLKKGDAIVHGSQVIGQVEDITYTDAGKVQVNVNIQEAYRNLAKQSSLFFVNAMKEDANKVIELVTNASGDDKAILDGQVVSGSDRVEGVLQNLSNQFGEALQSFSDKIQTSFNEWKEETLEHQIAFLEQELDRVIEKAKDLNDSARKYLKEDVMPQINQKIDRLRQELKERNRENELEEIEKKLEQVEGYLYV